VDAVPLTSTLHCTEAIPLAASLAVKVFVLDA
jgi:hypothetical protein